MLVISAGMQKSGSAYIYNLINDLLIASGNIDAREIAKRKGLQKLLRGHNNNIGRMKNGLILQLLWHTFLSGRFAVKTHSGPSSRLNALMSLGLVKTIYIYRDPRDVLMSVQDHGRKVLAEGGTHVFTEMIEMDVTLSNVRKWVKTYRSYIQNDQVLCISYENLLKDPHTIVDQVCRHLKIQLKEESVQSIIKKYDRNNPNADLKGLHFNKAKAKRYKTELSAKEQFKVQQELEQEIKEMGYELQNLDEITIDAPASVDR